MFRWLRDNYSTIYSWVALLGGALITFLVSRGTQFEPFTFGLLISLITLLVLLLLFEGAWFLATKGLQFIGVETSPPSERKSTQNSHEPDRH
jgi:peptidoglycan/LPS O-acetylase OafA/YrhL